MFYKNKEHYENTMKKVIREQFDVEVHFDSAISKELIRLLYETSDREYALTLGYDFLCYIKHKCTEFSFVSFALETMIKDLKEYYAEGDSIVEFIETAMDKLGYHVEIGRF